MATLKDISRRTGLSVTQVSRALNDHDDVSEATKERVRSIAKSLNYVPNLTARRLATGRSNIVGLVWEGRPETSEGWLFAQFVGGLSTAFSAIGLQFVLNIPRDGSDPITAYEGLIANRSIDGFVVLSPRENDARVRFLQRHRVPFVVHGRMMGEPDYAYYDIDNLGVGRDLTRLLLEAGHRDIAFLNGPAGMSFVERRRQGYLQALAGAGVEPPAAHHVTGSMTETVGALETIRLFQSDEPRPTGLIAGNMLIARGIFHACNLLGLSVPGEVSVVAHDDCLPVVSAEDLPVSLSSTVSPLTDAWDRLARGLELVTHGGEVSAFQKVGPHEVRHGQSVSHPAAGSRRLR